LFDEKKYGVEKVIFHRENKGVANAVNSGVKNVRTKLTMFSGDDDIIYCNNSVNFKASLDSLKSSYSIIIPRYVINLEENGEITLAYDRGEFNNVQALNLLKHIFITGEMYAFNAGAIYNTKDLKLASIEKIFRVSEDYIMLSKILANNLNKKIMVSDDYIYVRRVANDTLSKQLDANKLSLHLLSLITSGYYCLRNNLIKLNELIEAIGKRGQLLQNIYGYGLQFTELIIMYITNKVDLEDFIKVLKQNNILNDLSLETIPQEFIEIKNYVSK